MPWVSQSETYSQGDTEFLHDLFPEIPDILRAYHDECPEGEDYTLRVFQRLGQQRVQDTDRHDINNRIGNLVPQLLAEIYGRENVYTERGDDRTENRNLPHAYPDTQWVGTYTRHKVLIKQVINDPVMKQVAGMILTALITNHSDQYSSKHDIGIDRIYKDYCEIYNQLVDPQPPKKKIT